MLFHNCSWVFCFDFAIFTNSPIGYFSKFANEIIIDGLVNIKTEVSQTKGLVHFSVSMNTNLMEYWWSGELNQQPINAIILAYKLKLKICRGGRAYIKRIVGTLRFIDLRSCLANNWGWPMACCWELSSYNVIWAYFFNLLRNMAPGINHLSWFWSKTNRTYSRCQENDVVLVINSFSRDKKFDSFSHYFWCVYVVWW